MNIEETTICKYAGNKEQCKECSHAVNHLRGAGCMVPRDICVNISKRTHIETTVICEKSGSKKECEKCEHARPHLQNCGCLIIGKCKTICQEIKK